jgi:hypothetical protein
MKNVLNQIFKSKFLFIGLIIGLISSMGVKMIINPGNHRVPLWMFILTPIIGFLYFKFFPKKKV